MKKAVYFLDSLFFCYPIPWNLLTGELSLQTAFQIKKGHPFEIALFHPARG
jgi:hypothetical protein